MPIYAVVDDNLVNNLIVADEAFATLLTSSHQYVVLVSSDDVPPTIPTLGGLGWSYNGVSFSQVVE